MSERCFHLPLAFREISKMQFKHQFILGRTLHRVSPRAGVRLLGRDVQGWGLSPGIAGQPSEVSTIH